VKKAPVLILDDSSSALDMVTDRNLRKALSKLPYHPTVFIVSQRISSVIDCDRIVVLDDGRVAGIGTSDELLAACDTYREYIIRRQGEDRQCRLKSAERYRQKGCWLCIRI